MDKNMIKIDDLLRQRLGDAEEQERPGAWLHMKDLLDQQMPVRGVPGAFNWRRMFGYLGGLVLLLAVSAGGYQALQSFNSEAPLADNTGTGKVATPATGLAGVASNTAMPQEMQEAPVTAEQPEMAAVTNTTATQPAQQMTTTAGDEPVVATNNQKGNVAINDNNPGNNDNKKQQKTTVTGTKTITKTAVDATKNNKQDIIPASGNTTATGTSATQQPAISATQPVAANNDAVATKGGNTTKPTQTQQQSGASSLSTVAKTTNKTTTEGSELVAANKKDIGNATTNNKSTEPANLEKEVTFRKTEIHERESKNGVVKKDTIFNGEDVMTVKVPNDKGLLALNKKEDNNSGSNMNPAAAAPASNKETSEENAGMQKLGDHKVASKKMKNYNPHRFEEMVRNAKFRMGAMKFYPGIVGGINGTVNGNLGVHAGLAGNLSVSDRWTILAEVKYAHRLNFAKEKMQDDYITNVKFANINGQGVYTYDSMEHYYNFGSYASLEVPLMVTYSKDRWIYMLGANFRYNFKISNLQEVEQRYLLEQSLTSTTEPKFSTQKQILLTDFSPSMNIGPMAGVGYQFSPGLRLDLRVSNSLWNNSRTYGEKEISKSLHNIPQVQFNITHRFRSTKPYKRAQ
jgi:hypothetical protein